MFNDNIIYNIMEILIYKTDWDNVILEATNYNKKEQQNYNGFI